MTETRITEATHTNSTLNRFMELLLDNEWHTLEELTRQLKTAKKNIHKISILFDKFNFIDYDVTYKQVKIDSSLFDLYFYD